MNAADVLADDQLVEALRTGLPVQSDRLASLLAQWRRDVIEPPFAPTTPDPTREAADGSPITECEASS